MYSVVPIPVFHNNHWTLECRIWLLPQFVLGLLWYADRSATTQKTHNVFQIEAYSVYSDQRVT